MRLAIAVVAFVLGACASDSFVGVDPAEYSGIYWLERINGQPLPAPVATDWVEGNLAQGRLYIDWDSGYWMTLMVFKPRPDTAFFEARGNAFAGQADELVFVGRHFNVQRVGTWTDSTIVIPDFGGLHAEFRWKYPFEWQG